MSRDFITKHYFYKVPNDLILLPREGGVRQICVRYLIDEVRGVSDLSMTYLKYIMDNCGWKPRNGIDGINNELKGILSELISNGSLVLGEHCEFPPHTLTAGICFKVDPVMFDSINNYTMLYKEEFDRIVRNNKDNPDREGMLAMYLYVKLNSNSDTSKNDKTGFFQSYNTISSVTGFSKEKISKLLKLLVSHGLLQKYTVKPKRNGDSEQHFPNVYIPKLNRAPDTLEQIYRNTLEVMKGT